MKIIQLILKKNAGFSLVELVVFIVVIGIVAVAMIVPMNMASENSANPLYDTIAYELAQERMELILGQRYMATTFSSFADPCATTPTLPVCTFSGYTVVANISAGTAVRTITVSVTGPKIGATGGANASATLTATVGSP